MEKIKLQLDDDIDRMTQKQDDAVCSESMAPGSVKFDIVADLQNSIPYSSEALLIDNENAQELNWTANNNGRFEYTEGQWKTDIGGRLTV